MEMTVLEARRKWIDYLKLPTTKKYKSKLESYIDVNERCCLGHGCHVLIPEQRGHSSTGVYYGGNYHYPPTSFVNMVGLTDQRGSYSDGVETEGCESLAEWNDDSYADVTPQEIGEFLEKHIMGGGPFKYLDEHGNVKE